MRLRNLEDADVEWLRYLDAVGLVFLVFAHDELARLDAAQHKLSGLVFIGVERAFWDCRGRWNIRDRIGGCRWTAREVDYAVKRLPGVSLLARLLLGTDRSHGKSATRKQIDGGILQGQGEAEAVVPMECRF